MGRKDTITKEYMRNPAVFADAFNKYLYHGRQVIKPEKMKLPAASCGVSALASLNLLRSRAAGN